MLTKNFTILAVDDKPINLLILRNIIEEHLEANLLEANSGQQALMMVANHPIDLVILDVQMPEMDGFETAKVIRAEQKTAHIPIVFLTAAYTETEFQIRGYAMGAADYLTKPIDPAQLVNRIKMYLRFIEQERHHTQVLEQKVQERTAELQHARNELEKRVAERTAELAQANAFLSEANTALRVAKDIAEQANMAKNSFLANMSHELRTPLNAILSIAEVLLERLHGDLTEKQVTYIQTMHSSGRHLLSLINDILDLSKIEAGKLELVHDHVDIQAVCQSSLMFVKEVATKKCLKIHSDIQATQQTFVADQRRLKQILINLLNNAVKFTPKGGAVGLEVSKTSDESICFCVWDTGIGIPKDAISKLFLPFTQLDGQLNRQYSGTGLGLALVKRLVELHGGHITVQSEMGQGSRFEVFLPDENISILDTTESEAIIDQTFEKAANLQSPLILLVEDNLINQKLYADYLVHKGYVVMTASTGKEALQCIYKKMPDLILMDIQMPDMDGFEATRRIRAEPQCQHIPIIALTALAMSGDRERCLAAGVNAYISKPSSLTKILQAIERQLHYLTET